MPHSAGSSQISAGGELPPEASDPHLWLEEIEGAKPLAWCREQNARVVAEVGDPEQSDAYAKILAIADSKEKIPHVGRIGGKTGDEDVRVYYNFWQDAENKRGVWRRTSLSSFRSDEAEWEEVLSLDALNAHEGRRDGEEWVWHGYDALDEGPGGRWDRVLLFLSPGGTDAHVVREFDLVSRQRVDGGFETSSPAKCDAAFRTRDEVLIGTDFDGDGSSLTDSGYPRVVKSWRRGTPLYEASTVFEEEQGDISASQYAYHDRGHVHEFQLRAISFYATQQWYRSPDLSKTAAEDPTPFRKVPVPDDTTLGTFGDQATVLLRSAWAPPKAGREFAAGTLLSAPLASVLDEDWSQATPLFEPDAAGTTSLQSYCRTANYIVLETTEHVRSSLAFYRWDKAASGGGAWRKEELPDDQKIPVGETVGVRAVWPDDSDQVRQPHSGVSFTFFHPLITAQRARQTLRNTAALLHTAALPCLPGMADPLGLPVAVHFGACQRRRRLHKPAATQGAAANVRCVGLLGHAALCHVQGWHRRALLPDREQGAAPRRLQPDTARRVRRL
jgi:prolyl oligopeptidase